MRISTAKHFKPLKQKPGAFEQRATPHCDIRDYGFKHKVRMEWDLNTEAQKDSIFKLTVGDKTVLLDWQEVMMAGRFI